MDDNRRPVPGPRHADGDDFAVRPYALTRGRTRHSGAAPLPLEALVQAVSRPSVSDTPEKRRLLELCADKFESVAEISAHLALPVGVVRVVVGDLVESGQVRVHGLTSSPSSSSSSISLSVLESVLDGISSL
ncbi:DUF742 domain-containing protein [Aquipuribacter nitratireducens]|uniref:DUF742 domain-containing protein n=1 Tax=Aquipuribacter nitratireducens TaxID=650104 RepID=A0ABW0GME4_9MICO